MSASNETEFGEFVFNNDLTTFEALSRLDVTNLGNEVTTLNSELAQTRSELSDLSVSVDNLVVRVNTDGFRISDLESAVDAQNTTISFLSTRIDGAVSEAALARSAASAAQEAADNALSEATLARSASSAAQETADNALSAANEARSGVNNLRNSLNQTNIEMAGISILLDNTIADLDVVRSIANTANSNAQAAQTTAGTALSVANNALSTASGARVTADAAQARAEEAFSLAQSVATIADRIFCKENSLITGWGVMNGVNTLFQMRATSTSSNIMMTNVRFTSAVRLGNGNQLPYTTFWIKSPGEFGQFGWPAARVRTGAWQLHLDGGSSPNIQLFITPFNIRDYT